jgi:hypothetical protein
MMVPCQQRHVLLAGAMYLCALRAWPVCKIQGCPQLDCTMPRYDAVLSCTGVCSWAVKYCTVKSHYQKSPSTGESARAGHCTLRPELSSAGGHSCIRNSHVVLVQLPAHCMGSMPSVDCAV